MKRCFRGLWTLMLSVSMVWVITGCQEQKEAKNLLPEEGSPQPAATALKEEPEPPKPVEEQHPTRQEVKKPSPSESKPKEAVPAQVEKPMQTLPPSVPQTPKTAINEPVPEPVKQQIVTLSITGDEQAGTILSSMEVVIQEGDTVLDVLKKATREKKIHMEYRGSGAAAYVEGIDNLYEFDRGPKSGWIYRVNGVFGKKSAGDMTVKPNDRIEWLYTLDLGKDLE